MNTRRKARLQYVEATGTGGGPKKVKDLSDFEQRLLALLSKITVTGMPGIPEAGIEIEEPNFHEETTENNLGTEYISGRRNEEILFENNEVIILFI